MRFVIIYVGFPLLGSLCLVHFFSMVPVLLTKEFAQEPLLERRIISKLEFTQGKKPSRRRTVITFTKNLAIGQNNISFIGDLREKNPNICLQKGTEIILYGKKCFFGSYIEGFNW